MDKKIEIFENTLLKLLVRRGIDVDRQQVKLSTGELGYTTDTKRLYIGDGQTNGGVIAGNLFIGSTADITTLANVCSGDFAYDNDNNKFYTFNGGASNNINNWREVGGVYTATNGTVAISNTNQVQVGTLSAGNFSTNALGSSLEVDTNLKVALSSTISVDRLTSRTVSHLELPSALKIGTTSYNWPSNGNGSDLYLKTDISGNLSWALGSTSTSLFVANTAGLLPVGTIMPFVSSANAPSGWLLCNGQLVSGITYPALSAVLKQTYGGTGSDFRVPDLINKTLYGVSTDPATSTLFRVSSGTNTSLSATGVLYVIKAIPDSIVSATITVNSPLTSTTNGVNTTGTAISILSGTIAVGSPAVITSQTVSGPFNVDAFGRVIAASSSTDRLSSAGIVTNVAPASTPVFNTVSPISFLRTPIDIYNISTTTTTSFISTISAYPKITKFDGNAVSTSSVPLNAKNLIVDCSIAQDKANETRYVLAAPDRSLLDPVATTVPGATEYVVGFVKGTGTYTKGSGFTQAIIPLSANNAGDLVCSFRLTSSTNDAIKVRVVGYTL
jgi:microcystin-dependent protein